MHIVKQAGVIVVAATVIGLADAQLRDVKLAPSGAAVRGDASEKNSTDRGTPDSSPSTPAQDTSTGGAPSAEQLQASQTDATPPSGEASAAGTTGAGDSNTTASNSAGEETGAVAAVVDPAALGLEITIADAKSLFDQGIRFIDARAKAEFELSRVPRALHLPPEAFTTGVGLEVLNLMPVKEEHFVIYCGGGECHASHNLAVFLEQAGYTNLHIIKEGLPGWIGAGHEIEEGG
ncbi:MAG: rhodanese-like domain-containing protein [Planctomycetota bacterium]|nr:rhodanese-like domain-containing protein [Planctomycetota bacterium]